MGNRPAVLLIDLFRAFTDPESPLAMPVGELIEPTARLLREARALGVPVVHTIVRYHHDAELGVLGEKNPVLRLLTSDSPLAAVDPRLDPDGADLVVDKKGASAFHASTLRGILNALGVDSVVVAGVSTSGCVRATVVDAIQLGLRPIVVRECTADRSAFAHEIALADIEFRYGDVESLEYVIAGLHGIVGDRKDDDARRN
ncbi:N-carbamoylsarcosine amidase [Acrocarpospora pleiomorpha]|uniref:N-carbamoylsarcosine amidase n=2 Tax=Acrocarpospora pleiomorpha TaxID=90975 RepID=A0A5M3XUZ1_9ACTN|nr:isochorismatase family protein [Acrocarpospora pleiomorpha]GES24706.1 N-carbamoylsarcosine amidase [Acrocarpospora pleiomorpha]